MGSNKSLNWDLKIFSDIYQKCKTDVSTSPDVIYLSSLAWHLLSMHRVWIFLPDFPSPAHIQQMVGHRYFCPLVQQASQTGSAGPRLPIMVHPSVRGHSRSQPRKKGRGSALFPGVQCRKRWDGAILPLMLCPAFLSLSQLCSLAGA